MVEHRIEISWARRFNGSNWIGHGFSTRLIWVSALANGVFRNATPPAGFWPMARRLSKIFWSCAAMASRRLAGRWVACGAYCSGEREGQPSLGQVAGVRYGFGCARGGVRGHWGQPSGAWRGGYGSRSLPHETGGRGMTFHRLDEPLPRVPASAHEPFAQLSILAPGFAEAGASRSGAGGEQDAVQASSSFASAGVI